MQIALGRESLSHASRVRSASSSLRRISWLARDRPCLQKRWAIPEQTNRDLILKWISRIKINLFPYQFFHITFSARRSTTMSAHPRLLDHPFYQAWNRGEISTETLSAYHQSYAELIRRLPSYWQRVVDAFQQDLPRGASIVGEEIQHIPLWELWGRHLSPPHSSPCLDELIDALDRMTPSELLGAIQAFETQQPEVARTKKEGLRRFYGFREEDLVYFDEHLDEKNHIAYGSWLGENFADRKGYQEGFAQGAKLIYRSLDKFPAA